MLVQGHQLQESADWFLTTPSGDLALRIVDGLSIGEDEDGELLLNPGEKHRFVCFEVNADSSLAINTATTLFKFRHNLSQPENHVRISAWQAVNLKMPSGLLTIGTELESENSDRDSLEIELVLQPDCSAPTFTLTAVTPVATAVAPPKAEIQMTSTPSREPDWPELSEAGLETESDPVEWLTQELQVPHRAPHEEFFASQTNHLNPDVALTVPETVPRAQPKAAEQRKLSKPVLVLVTNLALLFAFGWWATPNLWPDLTAERVQFELVRFIAQTPAATAPAGPDPLKVPPPSELLQSIRQLADANDQQDKTTIDFMIQSLAAISASNPSNTEANTLLTELTEKFGAESAISQAPSSNDKLLVSVPSAKAEATQLAAGTSGQIFDPSTVLELRQIEDLIRQGSINTPIGNNAVGKLQNLLTQDPGNILAQNLLDQCADELVAQASLIHRQGGEYEARNILEDVLAFRPSNVTANALWHDWVDGNQ